VHGFIEARPEESVDACREDSGRRPDPGKISRDSVNLLLLQEINEKKAGGVVSARR
jgi:hypothetical protein